VIKLCSDTILPFPNWMCWQPRFTCMMSESCWVCRYRRIMCLFMLTAPKTVIRHMADGSALGRIMLKLRRMSNCFSLINICRFGFSAQVAVGGGSCLKTRTLVLSLSGITDVTLIWRYWHCECCSVLSAYLCYTFVCNFMGTF